ncbi:MAG: SHOCT domain-containing protein [Actinobacteria bacterium]|nr:SHOCT domain-containing protein [Actinomycetota bacterium]
MPLPDDATRARWRAEGKFYEFTGYSDAGIGHPMTITVRSDRVTTTPGRPGTPAPPGEDSLPIRHPGGDDAPLQAVERVEVQKLTVTQARIIVDAPPTFLTLLCARTIADDVRGDIEAAIGEAMVAAARQAVPETPVGVVADLVATGDPTERIAHLARLRSQGLLTTVEFEAKKRQILGR